jgi:hypothetical protein
MAQSSNNLEVYLEVGKKKTFAGAVEWPGWCRFGRDETSALQALVNAAPRYASILRLADIDFETPPDVSAFAVIERLPGNATTDFGAPGLPPAADARPLDDLELQRLQAILQACWQGLDRAAQRAQGKRLQTGPRGGGRSLDGILQHVRDAESSYLSSLGGKAPRVQSPESSQVETRQVILETLRASAQGEIAAYGPRGGNRWSARYFVRRAAWHVVDHIWEMEDRSLASYPGPA